MRELCSVWKLFEESVLIFQFLNAKIHNYVLFVMIVNFIIHKLKNKHTFLKKPQKVAKLSKAKFSCFKGTRGDKNQIFRTLVASHVRCIFIQSTNATQNTFDVA
jgi:hypothetical protein